MARGNIKPQLTHFLCLPLINEASKPQLEAALQSFKDDVQSTIPVKALRPPNTLHLTLGVMSLDQQGLKLATDVLQSLDLSTILGGAARNILDRPAEESSLSTLPLSVILRGLESMHNASSTSILYIAPKDTTSRLQPFCEAVQEQFKDRELLVADNRPLRLHATVVNTLYARNNALRRPNDRVIAEEGTTRQATDSRGPDDGSSGHGPKARGSMRLDARELLDKYATYQWTEEFALDRIAICEMGAKKQYDEQGRIVSEQYKEVAQIALR